MKKSGNSVNKIMVVVILLVVLLGLGMFLYGVLSYRAQKKNVVKGSNIEKTFKVVWDNKEYKGTYEGELENSKSSGVGTFVADDESLIYEGDWIKGKFSGNGKITYEDGTYEEGIYSAGKRDGKCIMYQTPEDYKEVDYKSNRPYGQAYSYKAGALTDVQLFAAGKSVEAIKEDSYMLTPDIISDNLYSGQIVFVEGIVRAVDEAKNRVYFRLESSSVGMVIGSYKNVDSQGVAQAMVPNMKVGDEIILYGYYEGNTVNHVSADAESYGTYNVTMKPVYGEEIDASFDLKKLEYKDISKYPYFYTNCSCEGNYVVDQVYFKKHKYYAIAHASNEKKEKICLMIGNEDITLCSGMTIKVSGHYAGQYKVLENQDKLTYAIDMNRDDEEYDNIIKTYHYKIYPLVEVISVQ